MPTNAVVSILHRVSGFTLFLAIPLLLLMLQCSLSSAEGFQRALNVLSHPIMKLLELGLVWAFAHHFLAGLRHLAMDVHWGTALNEARITSKLVIAGALLVTVWAAWKLC